VQENKNSTVFKNGHFTGHAQDRSPLWEDAVVIGHILNDGPPPTREEIFV